MSDRIFPTVLSDVKIYKLLERIKYVQYWEKEVQELNEAMESVSVANLQGLMILISTLKFPYLNI